MMRCPAEIDVADICGMPGTRRCQRIDGHEGPHRVLIRDLPPTPVGCVLVDEPPSQTIEWRNVT